MNKVFAIVCIVCSLIWVVGGFVKKEPATRIIWSITLGLWIYNLTQMK